MYALAFSQLENLLIVCYISQRRWKTTGLFKGFLNTLQSLNVLQKKSPKISFSSREAATSARTSAPLPTRWNCYHCILKTYLFALQPSSAFLMCNFVYSRRFVTFACAGSSRESTYLYGATLVDFYVMSLLSLFLASLESSKGWMQAQHRDVFKKPGILNLVRFNQSFRLIKASLRSTEESEMLLGLDFVQIAPLFRHPG